MVFVGGHSVVIRARWVVYREHGDPSLPDQLNGYGYGTCHGECATWSPSATSHTAGCNSIAQLYQILAFLGLY